MNVSSDPLAQALEYAQAGWRVLTVWKPTAGVCSCPKGERCPSPGKHPRTRRGFGNATTDGTKIRSWRWKSANVGIAPGPESGLLVIDLDPRNGGKETVAELKARLGDLPAGPRVSTGGAGFHLYLAHPPVAIRSRELGPGLEIKSEGTFVVAPPSIHASGKVYRWDRPPNGTPPDLPARWLDFLLTQCVTQGAGGESVTQGRAGNTGNTGAHRGTQGTQDILACRNREKFADSDIAILKQIEKTIEENQPTETGKRHWCLFHLARALKAIPGVRELPLSEMEVYFAKWHEAAKSVIGTKGYSDSWWDFCESWEAIRFAKGEGTVTIALERARVANLPVAAQVFDDDRIALLVAWCGELDRETGGQPFFLSTRAVAQACDVDPMTASRWLRGLCRPFKGHPPILELIERGTAQGRKASVFRYLGADQ